MLVGDGCSRVFKHEVPITFGENADDWLLDGLKISTFKCGILNASWSWLLVATERGLTIQAATPQNGQTHSNNSQTQNHISIT